MERPWLLLLTSMFDDEEEVAAVEGEDEEWMDGYPEKLARVLKALMAGLLRDG